MRNLLISFENGESETLLTEIDPTFEAAIFKSKKIFIGHFPIDGLNGTPTDEYYVPKEL